MLALSRREGETTFVGAYEVVVLSVGKELAQIRIAHAPSGENIFVDTWIGNGKEVRIGNSIVVWCSVIRDKTVRLSFKAPREISILRSEISGRCAKSTNRAESGQMDGRTPFPGIH